MAKTIQTNKEAIFVFAIGLVLATAALVGMYRMVVPATPVSAASATETINVTATVSEWISFSVSSSTVALAPDLVDTSGATAIASSTDIVLVTGTNDASGLVIQIKEDNNDGLLYSGNSIDLASATATIAAGTDGYGVQATTTSANTSVADRFAWWGNHTVGQMTNTAQPFVTSTAPVASATTTMKLKAACDALQPAGSYADTITLYCIGAS